MDTDTLGSTELDYFTYFFLLSKANSGLVVSAPEMPGPARPEPMASQKRGFQLFKPVPIPDEPDYVRLQNESQQVLVLATDAQGNLTATLVSDDASQRWMFTADGQLRNAASATAVLTLAEDGQSLAMRPPVVNEPRQVFERFFPSDFSYIRNTWFGHFLTAHDNGTVSWEKLNTGDGTERQQWGATRDGFLFNRAFAKVLQSAASGTTEGKALTIGVPNASGSSSLYQRFDVVAEDGGFHNRRDTGFVIACDEGRAVLQQGTTAKQFAEFISPFQFFRLFTSAVYGGNGWLYRGQTSVGVSPHADSHPNELFTVSRYGELISYVDGFVVRSLGAMNSPTMVDTALPQIGFADTTFQYAPIADYPDFGTILLRDASLRLTCVGRTPIQAVMDRPGTKFPWRITPPAQSMMSVYPYVAREYFSQPAPLPGMAMWSPDVDLATLDPETAALVADLDRGTRVAVTAVLGIIEIFTGFGPNAGTAWRVADRIAGYLFANRTIADTIALLMVAGAPVGLLINLADEILKADLWLKIFALLIPSSYWGWAIAVAKISLSVAQWIPGAGWPVFGGRLVILMAEIGRIVAEDAAAVAIEMTLLAEHSARAGRATPSST